MPYKYKLKEIEVGDTQVSKGIKSTVKSIDPETGTISWDVDYVAKPIDYTANIVRTFKEFQELRDDIKQLSNVTNDMVINNIAEQAIELFNQYKSHIGENYPNEYERAKVNEEDVDERSTSAGAGSYLSKYAFKKPKKQEELPEGIGATLGPGPSASEEGVKDNYYVKKFKFKLVPKDKKGNYVQKGSGLEVKNF
jgi:hypothetical protein